MKSIRSRFIRFYTGTILIVFVLVSAISIYYVLTKADGEDASASIMYKIGD